MTHASHDPTHPIPAAPGAPSVGGPLGVTTPPTEQLGPYLLLRRLAPCPLAERWLALHGHTHSSHVLYRFAACRDRASQRRFVVAAQRISQFQHAHALTLDEFAFDLAGRPWGVTVYTGDADGLVTVERLLRTKGGRMTAEEARLGLLHLLEASAAAHDTDLAHGRVSPSSVLVDRSGRLRIELYGLTESLYAARDPRPQVIRDEVRSIAEIGYQMLSGLRVDEPFIPPRRVLEDLPLDWDRWFRHALVGGMGGRTGGFTSARQALAALPALPHDEPRFGRPRWLTRLSGAVGWNGHPGSRAATVSAPAPPTPRAP